QIVGGMKTPLKFNDWVEKSRRRNLPRLLFFLSGQKLLTQNAVHGERAVAQSGSSGFDFSIEFSGSSS
ncbi:MAG TPA: hypothetical protein DCY14_01805, partial [Anaerolineae bacterium]|nr:hypothetical protein [Anaerolineae bacterium]